MKLRAFFPLVGLFFLGLAWLPFQSLQAEAAPTPTPKPEPGMDFPGLLTPPPTVYPPSQAGNGAQTYFYICLVCHGDRGQGLDEWRKELKPPDNNCWQSKCHDPNHMQFGFTFPHQVPALKNPGMLLTFQNALKLHDFIKKEMPFQSPGSLSETQYWDLTAYLLQMNGVNPGPQPLSAANAEKVLLVSPAASATPPPQPALPSDPLFIAVGALLLAGAALAAGVIFFRRKSE